MLTDNIAQDNLDPFAISGYSMKLWASQCHHSIKNKASAEVSPHYRAGGGILSIGLRLVSPSI